MRYPWQIGKSVGGMPRASAAGNAGTFDPADPDTRKAVQWPWVAKGPSFGVWDASKHPRGMPENAGEFKPTGGASGGAPSVSRHNPDLDAAFGGLAAKPTAPTPDIFDPQETTPRPGPSKPNPKRRAGPNGKPAPQAAPNAPGRPNAPAQGAGKQQARQFRDLAAQHAREGKLAGLRGDKVGAKRGRLIAAQYRRVAGFHDLGQHAEADAARRKAEFAFGLNSTATPPPLPTAGGKPAPGAPPARTTPAGASAPGASPAAGPPLRTHRQSQKPQPRDSAGRPVGQAPARKPGAEWDRPGDKPAQNGKPQGQPPASPPAPPHERTQQAALSAGNALASAMRSGGDSTAARQRFESALAAHQKEGFAAIDRMARDKFGGGMKASMAARRAKAAFVAKLEAARQRLGALAMKGYQGGALRLDLDPWPVAAYPWVVKAAHDVSTQAREPDGRFAEGHHQRRVSGVTWERSPAAADAGEVLIEVDTLALDAAWRKDRGYYLGFGGGADKVKYQHAKDFILSGERAVHAPRVHLDAKSGALSFIDGRNRAAACRDMDLRRLCVTVAKEDAARVRAALGGETKAIRYPWVAKAALGQWDESAHARESTAHDGKRPGEFAAQQTDDSDGKDTLYNRVSAAHANLTAKGRQKKFEEAAREVGALETTGRRPSGFRTSLVTPDWLIPPEADIERLSDPQKAALRHYTRKGDELMNAHLRRDEAVTPEVAAEIEELHKAFEDAPPFEHPVSVWRGIKVDFEKLDELVGQFEAAAKSGEAVAFKGFTSTSANPEVALDFGEVVFEITAKKGLYLEPITQWEGEREILMPHGAKFKVHGIVEANYAVSEGKSWSQKTVKTIQLEQLV
jgi:hypothetical protein